MWVYQKVKERMDKDWVRKIEEKGLTKRGEEY